jgi:enoyl-CoA hydratase/carnithine racemase
VDTSQKHSAPTKEIRVTDISTHRNGIFRWIELQRPEKLNCLNLEMLDTLQFVLDESKSLDGLILTGAGRSFCTGLDLGEIGGRESVTPHAARSHLQRLASIYRWFLTTKLPTVVLASGYAAGGGAGLVACAKTAIVSENFRIKVPGGKLARFAAIAVPLFALRAAARPSAVASQWLGSEFNANEAQRLGLVDAVVTGPRLAEILKEIQQGEIAAELLSGKSHPPEAVRRALAELEQFMDGCG